MAIAPLQLPSSAPFTPSLDLSSLVKNIDEGNKRRTLADLGTGLANGSIDYQQAAGKIASTGSLNGVLGLLQLGEAAKKRKAEESAAQSFSTSLGQLYGGGGQAAAAPTTSSAGGFGNAIAGIESGGKYDALGPVTANGDRAYGKYQVMGQNVGPWTREVLGKPMTPQEFAANPQAQDAVFQAKFGQYTQKYGPEGAARAWFAGEGGMNNPDARDQLGTSVADYSRKFTAAAGTGNDPAALPANSQPAQGFAIPGGQQQAAPNGGLSQKAVRLLQASANPNLPPASRETIKTLLAHELQASELTGDQKEYLMSRAEGFQGNFTDWKTGMKRAGATAITNDMRGENAEAKAAGEAAGKRRSDMFSTASMATKGLMNLSRMGALLGQVEQGKIQPARMNVSAWAKSFGLNDDVAKSLGLDPNGVGSAQALQALTAESVVGKIGQGGFPANNFSDADREFIMTIFPSIANDPRANKLILEVGKRVYQMDIDKAREYQSWKRDPANKGLGFEDFETKWADNISKKDMFGDLRAQAEAIIGPPRDVNGGQQQPQNAAPPVPGARQAPDGKFYIQQNGKWFRVDQ